MLVSPAYGQESAPAEAGHGAGEQPPADGAHAGTEVPHEGGHAGFPPFDTSTFPSQILWLLITFGLFYLFLKRVVMPRIGGIVGVRADRIAQDLDQATRMKGEADAAVAAYEQELAEARNKAGLIAQEARDGAKKEAETRRKAVEAELDKKLVAAESRIADIKSAAMKEVGSIAEQTAQTIVEELVGGNVSKAELASAVIAARGKGGAVAAGIASAGVTPRAPAVSARARAEADEEVGVADHPVEGKPSLDDPNRPKGVEKPAAPDDLGLIRGVGPKIEGILHSLGIFTFAQIAAWTAAERAWVDGYLNFKGRIDRDEWVKQADALARGGVDEYVRVFGKQPK